MTIAFYAQKFAGLNANKNWVHWTAVTTHRAPHKPLLPLAVIDLFEQGVYQNNFIELNADLIDLFDICCAHLADGRAKGTNAGWQ